MNAQAVTMYRDTLTFSPDYCAQTRAHIHTHTHRIKLLYNKVKWIGNDRFVCSTKDNTLKHKTQVHTVCNHKYYEPIRGDASTMTLCKDSKFGEAFKDIQKENEYKMSVDCENQASTAHNHLHPLQVLQLTCGRETKERERKREVRLRYKCCFKTPRRTTSHYISTQHKSWNVSQPNKCGAPFGVSSEAVKNSDSQRGSNLNKRVVQNT